MTTQEDKLTVGELSNAIDVIIRASRNETTKRVVVNMMSDALNPDTASMIGYINDNYEDIINKMSVMFEPV